MKRGNGDDYDGLTSDYLINGTKTLFYYISGTYLIDAFLKVFLCQPWFQYLSEGLDQGLMGNIIEELHLVVYLVNYLIRVLLLSIMKIVILTVCNLLTNLILEQFNVFLQ